jgi:hypothetical protein
MQSRNQILLTQKTLDGVMLPAVTCCAFGGGNLPSARTQEVGNVDFSTSLQMILVNSESLS